MNARLCYADAAGCAHGLRILAERHESGVLQNEAEFLRGAADEIDRRVFAHDMETTFREQMDDENRKLKTALRELLRFHEEGEDGQHIPLEYWSNDYRKAVETAEMLTANA